MVRRVSLIIVVWGFVLAALLYVVSPIATDIERLPPPPEPPTHATISPPPPASDLATELAERRVFGTPEPVVPGAPPVPAPSDPPAERAERLIGTVTRTSGADGYAVVSNADGAAIVAVGSTLADGAAVVDIGRGRVELAERSTLTFEPGARSTTELLTPSPNLYPFARVVPHFLGATYAGFKVVGVRPGSIYRAIGMRSGDVVKAIDGVVMDHPEKAMLFFEALERRQAVTLEIERRGQPKTLRWSPDMPYPR